MKQRMLNTFIRIVKSRAVANALATVGYFLLRMSYFIIRVFCHDKSELHTEEARKLLNKVDPKPNMSSEANNYKPSKDLSIILPVYNSEQTIAQCIDSVLTQKAKYNYELIIINDGSTDKTKNIIEKYNDNHIIVINQENRGFSGARNRGIDECTGKYIMFLDSDDCLVGDCIDLMMDNAISHDSDITQASHYSFYDESSNKKYEVLKDCLIESDMSEMICNPGYPWAKLYKRELFTKVRFPLDVWFEDTIVTMLLFRMCKRVSVMSDVVYAYRINPNGITRTARESKKCINHYWVMEYCLEQSGKMGLPNDKVQYEIVKKHMSTLLYRRIGKMGEEVKESAFILAADMLDKIRPDDYICKGNIVERDIEKSFINRNYKLWKLASFVV